MRKLLERNRENSVGWIVRWSFPLIAVFVMGLAVDYLFLKILNRVSVTDTSAAPESNDASSPPTVLSPRQ